MTTHIFIVNSKTFKIHLENLFAGTGAKDFDVSFLNQTDISIHPTIERLLVGMSADACRIRKSDKIIFYLQQDTTRHNEFNLSEGKFFGVFKAKDDFSFIDDSSYLETELEKKLTFRTLLEPDHIYPKGITEWEALDEIKQIPHPYQMLWSLIYRKLRANRGNTMITLYESQRLIQLIRDKNSRKEYTNVNKLTFERETQLILNLREQPNVYIGSKTQINILPRLINKNNTGKQFEIHLQSYIVKNLGKNINKSLDNCLIKSGSKIQWIGNEVGCGVGMQSIDILFDALHEEQRTINPIELKSVELPVSITNQVKRYVDWLDQYYKTNLICDIMPIVISKKPEKLNSEKYLKALKNLKNFNLEYSKICGEIKLIEFSIKNNEILFEINNYEE